MTEHGGDADLSARIPRSRLYDYVDLTRTDQRDTTGPETSEGTGSPEHAATSTGAGVDYVTDEVGKGLKP
ncbi:hypothetical protein [Streptomyces sp. NPDC001135]